MESNVQPTTYYEYNLEQQESKENAMKNSKNGTLKIKTSRASVTDTVKKLEDLLKTKGINIFAIVDHSGGAQKAGLELAEEKLVIFGDPKTGTALMQENPAIGIELPLKILIWKDNVGTTRIAYQDPLAWESLYEIKKEVEVLKKMQMALDGLTEALTK